MGTYLSKLPPNATAHERAVIQRLGALQLEKNSTDEDYVLIDDGNNEKGKKSGALMSGWRPEEIPVQLMWEWQDALLKDPKNRSVTCMISSIVICSK